MPGPAEAVELSAVDGALRLTLQLPEGASSAVAAPLDLSAAPGVAVDVRRAWQFSGDGRVELACVRAAADRWVEGLEGAVLDGASATVRKLGGFASITPAGAVRAGLAVQQDFSGRTADGEIGAALHGKHVLGFTGAPHQVALCTVTCVTPRAEQAQQPSTVPCEHTAATLEVRGFVEAPPPGIVSRALGWTAAHPMLVGVGTAMVVLLGVALLLRRRPRPRW